MRPQMSAQPSMQMRPGMHRGMAPARNISASPQATVHRPGEESYYGTAPQQRRPPPDNGMQRRPAPPTYGKHDHCTCTSQQNTVNYYMAELLVHGEKEYFDWFPERSVFCYTDSKNGPLTN